MGSYLQFFTALIIGIGTIYGILKRANEWFLTRKFSSKIPPGDMGLPFIGNMLFFFKTHIYNDPDVFISYFTARFGKGGMYKALIFGTPSIIVTTPELCRKILMDDKNFETGWPQSVLKLIGKKALHGVSGQEHKRLRRMTAAPIKGHEALSLYLGSIEQIVTTSLERWAAKEEPFEFLTAMRKATFKVIITIIMGGEIDKKWFYLVEKEYSTVFLSFLGVPINLPGFGYHKALQAREKLTMIFQAIVDERKVKNSEKKDGMLDLMMGIEDEEGKRLSDEEIINLIIMYAFAGHESTAHASTWAIMYLEQHPEFLQKAKEEQEEIIKRRSSVNVGLNFDEIRQMKYLTKVINETLRCANVSTAIFRKAKTSVNMNGCTIPEGWKVLAWIRNVHMDSQYYVNPKEFNPSRWDDHETKPGTFLPFGAGYRLCPGADLARLEISVFLHYFLLNYRLEMVNPKCKVKYLPITSPTDNCFARLKKVSTS